MKKTLFAALALCAALGSCDTCNNTKCNSTEDITGKWLIVSAGDLATDKAEQVPFINFTDSGTVNGYTAVNNFFGNYATKGDSISFSHIGVTFMMGLDSEMDIETAVVHALNNGKTIEMEETTLLVKDTDGKTLMTLERE